MRSSNLAIELNRVYNTLYRLNESLSIYESKQLMKGFEDGIKEGWGSWIGKTAGNLVNKGKEVVKGAKDSVTGAYNKGKELAKQAWNSIKDFANDVYNTVNSAYNSSVEYIISAPGKIKAILEEAYKKVTDKVTSALDALKDKADELKDAINTIYSNVIKKTVESAKKVIAKVGDGKSWLKSNFDVVKQSFVDAKNSSIKWVQEAGAKGLEVLEKIGKGSLEVAKVLGFVVAGLIILPTQALIKGGIMLYNSGVEGADYVKTAVTNANNYLSKEFSDMASSYQKEVNESFSHIMNFNQFIK